MLKNATTEDGKPVPALRITENVCALYYPTAPQRAWFGSPSEPWLPDTSADAVEGYSKFLQDRMNKVFWWFAKKIMARARIPVTSHAPIAARDTPFPLVIFSHGLAGTRNTYSQFCSSLASEGYVVLAVEHADGSGPAVIRDGKPLTFRLFAETEWSIPPPDSTTPPPELMDFRARQLDFRMREVYDAYAAFSRLMSASEGDSITDSVTVDGLSSPGWFISSLRRHVDVDNLQLTGHSFGGATIKRLLCSETPAPYTPMPAKHAVLLDPWGEPEVLGHAPLLPPPANPPPPSVMINSQFWTELKYWPGMLTMCQEHGIALCTVVGLEHQGFSDFPLLISNKPARAFHATIHTLTMNCLTDSLPKCAHFGGPADGGDITFHDGKLQEGKKGDVLVHLKHKCD